MKPDEVDGVLGATLEDHRLSRGEKHALEQLLGAAGAAEDDRAFIRHRAFELARRELATHEDRRVLEWLEGVVKVLARRPRPAAHRSEVHFSPGPGCLGAIQRELDGARSSVDICVFTITDDRLASPILAAHRRGVRLRVMTDDDKSDDRGSDIHRLAAAGIEVRLDHSEHHMHHKFAVFDRELVVTGSYNWTRSAAEHNRENILITDDERLVAPYRRVFDEIWDACAPPR